jgi:PKD repeat protein
MTGDSGNLSIDFLVGFTIFLLAFIWVVSMIPGLLIGLQSYTIDSDAVAYRTGVILAEDPGEPALPLFPWETLANKDVVRFGLAVSKNTPNILSRNKVDKFFCSSIFSYPDDYQQRVIFGDYPFRFNISLIEFGRNETRSVGDIMSGNYGSIRRLVKIKEQSYATINSTNYMSGDLDNETLHEFSIVINNTELLWDKVRDPVYKIDPAQEKITINITKLSSTLNTTRKDCFNINLTKIYAKDPAFIRIQLFNEPVIDGIQYDDINTEGRYATLPSVNNNISLTFDPSFIPWSNYPLVYITLTFNLVKNASAPAYCSAYNGSRFFNNSLTSAFDYNYNPDNVKQPELIDGVLEVDTGSGYRTKSETLIEQFVANFIAVFQSGTPGPNIIVKFTSTSTGSPVNWDWDFGDGTPHGSINILTHTYTARGDYNVTLQVTNTTGGSVTSAPQTVKIRAIAATTGSGGNITPTGLVLVEYGTNQAFTISPNASYHITDVIVDGVSVGAVPTYTFNNVVTDPTISASFAFNAPTFTSITPNSGATAGGTPVTIIGTNFVAGGSFGVTIDGVAATSVFWVDSSHITAVTPARTAGARNVRITNNDGQTVTGTGAYTYV